jgi:hypothetical protein
MPTSEEYKPVQTRNLKYAETIGWMFVSSKEAEQSRGFDPGPQGSRLGSLAHLRGFLDAKV